MLYFNFLIPRAFPAIIIIGNEGGRINHHCEGNYILILTVQIFFQIVQVSKLSFINKEKSIGLANLLDILLDLDDLSTWIWKSFGQPFSELKYEMKWYPLILSIKNKNRINFLVFFSLNHRDTSIIVEIVNSTPFHSYTNSQNKEFLEIRISSVTIILTTKNQNVYSESK